MGRLIQLGVVKSVLVLYLVLGGLSSGAIITVSPDGTGDYTTIQQAIDNAVSGADEVVLLPGVYTGSGNRDIYMSGKAITLRSVNPDDRSVVESTVIDGQNAYRVFWLVGGGSPDTIIRGITIANGYHVDDGGGAYIRHGGTFDKCIFKNCTAGGNGGAVYNVFCDNGIVLTDCEFIENSAANGGACYFHHAPSILVSGCTFVDNSASGWGGAIFAYNDDCTIERCLIQGNEAGAYGGGIMVFERVSPAILNNRILDNRAADGGGIACITECHSLIANNIIAGNICTGTGGGIYAYVASDPKIINNTIIHNVRGGIAVLESSSAPTIANNIVAFNTETAGIVVQGTPAYLNFNCLWQNGVSGSNHYGGGAVAGHDDIIADPKLVLNPWSESDRFHIQPDSPCVDAGNDVKVQAGWVDMDGQPRIQGDHVDIGADESDGTWYVIAIVVRADGSGDYPTIQQAIDAATSDDVVVCMPGTYSGAGNVNLDLLGKAITVQSSDPDDPDVVAATVIDCSGGMNRGFYLSSGETQDSRIEGLTIANANAPWGVTIRGVENAHGGGILCVGASPVIRNCVFRNCRANYYGGGICLSGSNASIEGCVFDGCDWGWAPAIFVDAGRPVITDCTFINNQSGMHHAGAVALFDCTSGRVEISGCLFKNNSAANEVGALYMENSLVDVLDCSFIGNRAGGFGGAIGARHGSDLYLSHSLIAGNVSEHQSGGALFASDAATRVEIVNCTITDNLSVYGGALRFNQLGDRAIVKNSVVYGNQPGQFDLPASAPIVNYSNIEGGFSGIGNINADPLWVRPGFWDDNGTPEYPNDDFWNDENVSYYLMSQAGRWDDSANLGAGGWVLDDVSSPCIDAGDPADAVGDETLPHGGRINIGHFGGTAQASKTYFPEDISGDGKVDLADLAMLAAKWLVEI